MSNHRELFRFYSDMDDAVAELRCRASQLRTEAELIDRTVAKMTAQIKDRQKMFNQVLDEVK